MICRPICHLLRLSACQFVWPNNNINFLFTSPLLLPICALAGATLLSNYEFLPNIQMVPNTVSILLSFRRTSSRSTGLPLPFPTKGCTLINNRTPSAAVVGVFLHPELALCPDHRDGPCPVQYYSPVQCGGQVSES